jgi:hypothetical protein
MSIDSSPLSTPLLITEYSSFFCTSDVNELSAYAVNDNAKQIKMAKTVIDNIFFTSQILHININYIILQKKAFEKKNQHK